MSTPLLMRCECGNQFIFLRGSLEKCNKCAAEYQSHRDEGKVKEDDRQLTLPFPLFECDE